MNGRLYEALFQSSLVPAQTKQALKGVTLVNGDPVSTYYFAGNDKDTWDLLEDFPNVLPPWPQCFVDFEAPAFIESQALGHQPWTTDQPTQWGIFFDVNDLRREQLSRSSLSKRFKQVQRQFQRYFVELPPETRKTVEHLLQLSHEEKQAFLADSPDEHVYQLTEMAREASALQQGLQLSDDELQREWAQAVQERRWMVYAAIFLRFADGRAMGPVWEWRYPLNEQGAFTKRPHDHVDIMGGLIRSPGVRTLPIPLAQSFGSMLTPYLHTALLTICFLHCRNVVQREVEARPPGGPTRGRHRLSQPCYAYKVLDIAPMQRVLREEGQSETLGIRKALHLVRGHFAHYGEPYGTRKLFGKHEGTFWMPMHVRGSLDAGKVDKDYRVSPAKDHRR